MMIATLPLIAIAGKLHEFDDYAELTGGPVASTDAADAAERMGMLLDELRQRSTFSFSPDTDRPSGTVCHLQWSLTPAFFVHHPELRDRRRQLVVRARREYVR